MASTHKHIRSSTANKRPTTAIADGQIALNTNSTSPGLFFKDSTGATIIKVGPVHVGTTAPNVSPAAGGSSGNSTGEIWLDTSLTPNGVKIWNGASWTNATPIGSTTVQGLLELATNAETQTGTDPDRAVTPAGLQSKVSDSTSTTSSTTIASSTAVKAAYDLADAALPKAGGTVTGNLEIGTTGSLTFEGSTADGFETTLAVTDPTADRTITLPNVSGTVVTTGDTGTVTGTMIASGTVTSTNIVDGTIVDADISASAEIAVSKLADGAARQLLQTDAAGTGVEWASNIDIPGTLDVTSAATFDSTIGASAGAAATPSITFTGDLNTGLWSPGADTIAASTAGSERARIDSSGRLLVGTSTSVGDGSSQIQLANTAPSLQVHRNANDVFQAGIVLSKARGSSNQIVQNGDTVGAVTFQGADGSNSYFITAAQIAAAVDNTPGANSMPGRLTFSTTANGASSPTERVRIDSSGRVGIGSTSVSERLEVNGAVRVTNESAGWGSGTEGGFLDYYAPASQVRFGHLNGASGSARNVVCYTGGSEAFRVDSNRRLLVGTSTSYDANSKLEIQNGHIRLHENNNTAGAGYEINWSANGGATGRITAAIRGVQQTTGTSGGRLEFSTTADGASSPTEALRISKNQDVLIGTVTDNPGIGNTTKGAFLGNAGYVACSRNSSVPLYVNRNTDDGTLVELRQDGNTEGTISVSGTTVSYNGAHLSRWSQLPGGAERTEILRGTVLSNIDEMCEWGDEENEQLNRMKVSDVEGDKNASGVFQAWDDDDDTYTNDFYCAMTGDFIIRIAAGVTVERGDLLMSAGDGTAKPQDDDIIRSKTIAKVTSTNVTCTYDDGSYCVPCVLMAC